jgi:threonine dehydrogenase-like Zn-dependent dehydrogenase
MHSIYVDKNIPRALLTKAIAPAWPGFVWTPLSAARAAELPDPPLPGPRWLRLRNERCGICASDLSLLFVKADPAIAPAALPGNSRFFLGHEVVSVVTETGSQVKRFKVGDRVLMDTHFAGANCETLGIDPPCRYCAGQDFHFCVNKSAPGPRGTGGGFGDGYVTHESAVYPCPSDLTADQAVLTEPLAIPVHGVLRHPPRPGDRVLVIGAGIIGLLTVMTLRAMFPECEATVAARHAFQAEMAEKLGARHVLRGHVDYAAIAQLTGGKYFSAPLNKGVVIGGFDVIYDCVADAGTLNSSLRWVRAEGKVVMIGSHMAPVAKIDLTPVWYHQVDLVGTYGHGMNERDGLRRHTYEWVFDQFRSGKFITEGLITHRFPLNEYRQAISTATGKRKSEAIKVLIEN